MIFKKIARGIGANLYAQVVTVFIQLTSVPVFLYCWSVEEYGHWLMVSAVPIYVSMADFGLLTVSANKMTMLAAKGDISGLQKTFQSALFVALLLLILIPLMSLVISWITYMSGAIDGSDCWVFMLLVVSASINMSCGIFDSIFRAEGDYALGTIILNSARILEFVAGVVALFSGCGPVGVAGSMLASRLLAAVFLYLFSARNYHQFRWKFDVFSKDEALSMMRPSLAFMAFPFGNALVIQGVSMMVGTLFGGAFLVAFNSYRTISRSLVQLSAVLSRAMWPELSSVYAKGELGLFLSLIKKGANISSAFSAAIAVALYFCGPLIVDYWLHGKIESNETLFFWLLFVAVITSFWQVYMVGLMAVNRHETISIYYVMFSIMVMIFVPVVAKFFDDNYAVFPLIAFEISMLYVCRIGVVRLVSEK